MIVTAGAEPVLFPGKASNAALVMSAEVFAVPTVVAVVLMVTASDAPGASAPRSQVTTPAACVQVAPVELE